LTPALKHQKGENDYSSSLLFFGILPLKTAVVKCFYAKKQTGYIAG